MAARVTKVSIEGAGKVLEVFNEAAISPNREKVPATERPLWIPSTDLRRSERQREDAPKAGLGTSNVARAPDSACRTKCDRVEVRAPLQGDEDGTSRQAPLQVMSSG